MRKLSFTRSKYYLTLLSARRCNVNTDKKSGTRTANNIILSETVKFFLVITDLSRLLKILIPVKFLECKDRKKINYVY